MDAQQAINTTQPPHRAERFLKRLLLWTVGIVALFAAILWIMSTQTAWATFRTDLTTYRGVTIGQGKTEVQYALGPPQTVQGPYSKMPNGWQTSTPLRVDPNEKNDAIPPGYEPIPAGKAAKDYDEWHYWNEEGTFDVTFNAKSGRAESIACWVANEHPKLCQPLLGIGSNSTEEEVRRILGKPDKEETSGGETFMKMPMAVTKSMDYNRFGLRLLLEKKAVITLTKKAPQDVEFWWWFTHGQI